MVSMGKGMGEKIVVHLINQLELPARSEMEVLTSVDGAAEGGTWLLKRKHSSQCPVVIARAVVSPRNDKVIVRMLNPQDKNSHTACWHHNCKVGEAELHLCCCCEH